MTDFFTYEVLTPPARLHDTYGRRGAPRPGDRGYRRRSPARLAAEARAESIYHAARDLIRGDLGQLVYEQMLRAWDLPPHGEPVLDPLIEPDDLPTLVHWPELSPQHAADLLHLVMRASDPVGAGPPPAVATAMIADAIHPASPLRLVNVNLDRAVRFIADHHRTMPLANRRGLMYAVGACKGRRLVAVATAGTPTGRWANPHAASGSGATSASAALSAGSPPCPASTRASSSIDPTPHPASSINPSPHTPVRPPRIMHLRRRHRLREPMSAAEVAPGEGVGAAAELHREIARRAHSTEAEFGEARARAETRPSPACSTARRAVERDRAKA